MGISVIDHISEMVGPVPENEKFDCLGFLAARLLNPETLEDSIHRLCSYDSRIKKRLESKKIHFIGPKQPKKMQLGQSSLRKSLIVK